MKGIFQFAGTLMIAVVLLQLAACKGSNEEEKSEQLKAYEKLSARTWKMKAVTRDEVDVTADFTGMTLSFSESTVTATNGKMIWPAQESWSFVTQEATSFTRGDQVTISISQLTETSLSITMQWNTSALGQGRNASVQGEYVFSFE